MKKSVRFLTFLLCVSLFVSLIPLHSGADGATETTEAVEGKPYIGEGLIAWYDGTNNANGFRDPMTDFWKDLTGNINHLDLRPMVFKNAIYWGDDALMVNPETGLYLAIPYNVKKLLEDKAYTIELVLGEITYDNAESATLLSSSNGEVSFGFDREEDGSLTLAYRHGFKNTQYPTVPNAEGYFGNRTLAITSDAASPDGTADGLVTLYSDGAPLASERVGYSTALDYLYLGHRDLEHGWGGELHGLRIYDRVLTPDELAANAAADRFNYRQGNDIDPVERYDPELDPEEEHEHTHLSSYILDFHEANDLIPLLAESHVYDNVRDPLYATASDGESWDGARIMRAGQDKTDVRFRVDYGAWCDRFKMRRVSGADARYMGLGAAFDGVFDEMQIEVVGYDEESEANYGIVCTLSADDVDWQSGTDQFLALDTKGVLDELETIEYVSVEITGMDYDTRIYLKQLAFLEDADDAERYTGIAMFDLSGYTADRLVFDRATNMVSTAGLSGRETLHAPSYSRKTDAVQWEGARLTKRKDIGSGPVDARLAIRYDDFCERAGLTPTAGKDCQYVRVSFVINGKLEELSLEILGYDEDSDSTILYESGPLYGSIDFDKPWEVQTLILDVDGAFDECEAMTKIFVDIKGMDEDTEIYLREIEFIESEKEAYGNSGPDCETVPDQNLPETSEATRPQTDTPVVSVTESDTTGGEGTQRGCASAMGAGGVILLALGAAVIFRKQKE